eukprot:CAMPEP_0118722102 /NCGR_PEP_ID=MMETSP0800-20121206/31157_1 /TAXON_ID=210618 ORGANISM="Striatella unipunctata, Strain CCMP2910" /NCGR_SAMPLE_ID=MMETSP0800 /ASSEMBLY_ACC=CAM_ASM_000638 /LENGTH=498 /DNA_ID=CAMNT_0006630171 /DNA_START=199 /DNA_END=1695 /DNA_ORIENTATION=+
MPEPPKLPNGLEDLNETAASALKPVAPPAIFHVHRWSLEEDVTLLRAVPIFGHMWAAVSSRLIPHRDRGHLRKRYQVLERRIASCVDRMKNSGTIKPVRVDGQHQSSRRKPALDKKKSVAASKATTTLPVIGRLPMNGKHRKPPKKMLVSKAWKEDSKLTASQLLELQSTKNNQSDGKRNGTTEEQQPNKKAKSTPGAPSLSDPTVPAPLTCAKLDRLVDNNKKYETSSASETLVDSSRMGFERILNDSVWSQQSRFKQLMEENGSFVVPETDENAASLPQIPLDADTSTGLSLLNPTSSNMQPESVNLTGQSQQRESIMNAVMQYAGEEKKEWISSKISKGNGKKEVFSRPFLSPQRPLSHGREHSLMTPIKDEDTRYGYSLSPGAGASMEGFEFEIFDRSRLVIEGSQPQTPSRPQPIPSGMSSPFPNSSRFDSLAELECISTLGNMSNASPLRPLRKRPVVDVDITENNNKERKSLFDQVVGGAHAQKDKKQRTS